MWHQDRGFTLIELLVVVTIIVVLLALLTPALDKAIYAAELASCGAQQHGIVAGAINYAMNNKRRYPYRAGTNESTSGNYFPMYITLPFNAVHNKGNPFGYDDRPLLRPYMSMKAMLCPMAPEPVDFEGAPSDSYICTSYSLWFGWKYTELPQNHSSRGLERYGMGWTFSKPHPNDASRQLIQKFSVLMGDTHGQWGFGLNVYAHPDRDGRAIARVRQEEAWGGGPAQGQDKNTLSFWEITTGLPSGPQFDENYGFEDGSVRSYKDVYADIPWAAGWTREEEQMTWVPIYHRVGASYQQSLYLAIPRAN
jgi:prepilin-type N-terminal cleavage/methylation domain-containing protein